MNDYATAAADYKQALQLRKDMPELWANLGLMQHETGDYASAIQSFRQANRLKPSLYVPNLFLGIDYVRTNRPKEAVPLLLAAEKMNDRDPLPSLTLGRAYTSLGEYQLAGQQLRRAVQIDPKQSSAWFALGIVYLHQVESDSRIMTGEKPDSSWSKALFAEALVKQSRYKEGADLYRGLPASTDQPPCIQAEVGMLDLRQGNADAAAQQFQTEHNAHPECTLSLLGEARLQIDGGHRDAAVPLLQTAWTRDPAFFSTNVADIFAGMTPEDAASFISFTADTAGPGMSDALRQAAQGSQASEPQQLSSATPSFNAAKSAFDAGHDVRCTELARGLVKSGNTGALRLLATCAYFSGQDEIAAQSGDALRALSGQSTAGLYWSIKARERLAMNALVHFQQLEPNSARSHILLGDLYRQRRLYDEAQKEYSLALELSPEDPAALLGLASACFGSMQYDKAIATAQKVLAKTPDDPETNVLMGEALLDQHKYADAEPYLLKGLNAKPQMRPHVHAMLGESYAGQGRTAEAVAQMKAGLESDEDGSLHYQLARLYMKTGDKADADTAIAQMKTLLQQRRRAAVTAMEDIPSLSLDDEP